MSDFIPHKLTKPSSGVPYFEDNAKTKIPGRGTHKTTDQLAEECKALLRKLEATHIEFVEGTFPTSPKRYGYRVEFWAYGAQGRIDVAALPLRNETPARKRDALEQALFLFRNALEAQVYVWMYQPNYIPLLPYLIGAGGKTVTEALIESKQLPMLGDGR